MSSNVRFIKKAIMFESVYLTYKYDSTNYLIALRDAINVVIAIRQGNVDYEHAIEKCKGSIAI